MTCRLHRLLCAALLGVLCAAPAFAVEKIAKLDVLGTERVEPDTVRSYLPLREGDTYRPDDTRQAIKDLYATGLFETVDMAWDDATGTLSVKVKENPIVNEIAFEGNDALDDEKLTKLIALKSRQVFTPGKAQADVNEILAAYRASGRFLAQVTPQIIRRDQNRIDLIFKISEGKRTRITKIDFVGNNAFSDGDLGLVVSTRESAWFRFLTDADSYDPDRLEFDKELLRRYYVRNGYADFRVVSAVAELTRDKDGFFVTYTVEEGPQYKFGVVDVRVEEGIEVDRAFLQGELFLTEGEVYDGSQVEKNVDALIDAMGSKGFAFIDVEPLVNKNDAERTIDITFNVKPGPRVYVDRINIKGNTRTRDYVIRREMRLAEGDAFSSNRLQRSKDRLSYLGFFEKTDIERQEGDAPDKMNLDVTVTEQSTGEFNIGAGFSSEEGALGNANIKERNFLGKGQEVGLDFSLSSKRQDFNFSFTEPYFLGQELSAGIDLYNLRRDYQSQSSYDQQITGGGTRLGFPMGEFTRNTVSLNYRETEINNVDRGASQFVKRDEGKRNSAVLGNLYAIDTRDSLLLPTKGYRAQHSIEYSGFGTDIDYVRNLVSGSWHKTLRDDWVLSLGARAGVLSEIGGRIPLYENFTAGGATLRGFARSGIGPRDRITDDALGGKYVLGNNAELRFPIRGLEEFGVNGILFSDGGIVTEFEDSPNVVDTRTYRVSAGTGIFWRSPMGPLRFEFGFPLVKAAEDDTEVFSFNFGTRF